MTYLLDSTLLIDHFNGIEAATRFLLKHIDGSLISVVTLAEVLSRPADADNSVAHDLLSRLPVLPLDEDDGQLAAKFRRMHKLKLPDAFQAALAVRHGLGLVTRNTKDFNPAEHAFILVPYKI